MPLISIKTSCKNLENSENLVQIISDEISILTGKSGEYIMTIIESNCQMTFAGKTSPCCYIEIKSIGSLNTTEISKSICNIISSNTEIASNRIYISFEEFDANNWGYNGNTFG